MKLNLSWRDLYPVWIETRGGKFFTTTYDDSGIASWAYVVAQYTSGLYRRDNQVVRFYPFWDSAPRCKDTIHGIWDNYQEAKDYLLTTQDELCYLAGCWILGPERVYPHTTYTRPEIRESPPEGI